VPLSPGQSFEITFKAVSLDVVPMEAFLHAVEFWITTATESNSVQAEPSNLALGFGTTGGTEWSMHYWVFGVGYIHTRERSEFALGQPRIVRMTRRSDGIAEFFLDGVSVLTVEDFAIPAFVRARVVGCAAEFSYLPVVSAAANWEARAVGPRFCGECPSEPATDNR
jgi:hypothetical protein